MLKFQSVAVFFVIIVANFVSEVIATCSTGYYSGTASNSCIKCTTGCASCTSSLSCQSWVST